MPSNRSYVLALITILAILPASDSSAFVSILNPPFGGAKQLRCTYPRTTVVSEVSGVSEDDGDEVRIMGIDWQAMTAKLAYKDPMRVHLGRPVFDPSTYKVDSGIGEVISFADEPQSRVLIFKADQKHGPYPSTYTSEMLMPRNAKTVEHVFALVRIGNCEAWSKPWPKPRQRRISFDELCEFWAGGGYQDGTPSAISRNLATLRSWSLLRPAPAGFSGAPALRRTSSSCAVISRPNPNPFAPHGGSRPPQGSGDDPSPDGRTRLK